MYSIGIPLTYTEADPLAANPINDILWIIFEGLYKFAVNSQLASKANIQKCQNPVLNMVILDQKAIELYQKGDHMNAWFTFSDSFSFSHSIVEGCYHMGHEMNGTFKKIKEQVIGKGKIWSNLLHNLYFVLSGVGVTWSQIYYRDWLNLIGGLGSIVYRVFVHGLE